MRDAVELDSTLVRVTRPWETKHNFEWTVVPDGLVDVTALIYMLSCQRFVRVHGEHSYSIA